MWTYSRTYSLELGINHPARYFRMQKLILLLLPLCVSAFQPSGKIMFRNASFEDKPATGKCPKGWYSGYMGSTPDVLPGAWEIMSPLAQDGQTYIGLIVREDGTREDIRQAMVSPLVAGQCYSFSVFLAHAPQYVGYNQPTRLRIWGRADKDGPSQLLATSTLIDHTDWREYEFELTPTVSVRHLIFEADYAPGVVFKYRGNLLIDHCTPLKKCIRA